jgi:nucleotide-binding universal stress UspA family protein
MYQHILLPTDGSELSERAIEGGVQLAKALGARVSGLHVVVESHVATGLGESQVPMRQLAERAAQDYLKVIAAAATQAGVAHECFTVVGDSAWEEIIHAATNRQCDLVFMASHGRRGLAGVLLGSQTVHVLTHSKIPVLVCR